MLGVRPEMIPDSLETAAELKETISRRQFAPSDEGREMTQALIEMLEKNSPPLLESIPTGLMRLFIQAEIARLPRHSHRQTARRNGQHGRRFR